MREISVLLFQSNYISIKLLMYILVISVNFSRRAKILRSINASPLSGNSNLAIGKLPEENKNSVQAVSSTLGSGKFQGFLLCAYWGDVGLSLS